ncbi:DUF3592 domain-containing protein [Halobaculum sp. MBLA0147]|uniref:DUF3592 domain-containing protein n=1 Tax=Halobaculum sp. MBLA0147 TaxID=3079934 RepID=UPI0035238CCD
MQFSIGDTTIHAPAWRVIVALLAVAAVAFTGYDYVQQSRAIDDATAVEATVVEAEVRYDDSGRGGSYGLEVQFDYRYRGTAYTGDRVFPGAYVPTYDEREAARAALDGLEPGDTTRVYVPPDAPGEAFLNDQRPPGTLDFFWLGLAVLVIVALDAIGPQNPDATADLRPEGAVPPVHERSVFGRFHDPLGRWTTRSIAVCTVTLLGSFLVGFGLIVLRSGGIFGPAAAFSVDPTDPIGIAGVVVAASYVGLVVSLSLYGAWSFVEYRRLRERLADPTPPSPFRNPSRLVTLVRGDDDDPNEYVRRVRLTGSAVLVAAILTVSAVQVVS